jgi:hypothetical protein
MGRIIFTIFLCYFSWPLTWAQSQTKVTKSSVLWPKNQKGSPREPESTRETAKKEQESKQITIFIIIQELFPKVVYYESHAS